MFGRVSIWSTFVIAIIALLDIAQRSDAQPRSGSLIQATSDEADRLDKLVTRLRGEGKFREAIPLAEQSVALHEKALGLHHPDVARSLNNLADLYYDQGAYAKAEPLYLRAEPLLVRSLKIHEKTLGPIHPDVARCLKLDPHVLKRPEHGQ
jgi:tetratricopeptide (TPR) repeat protein